MRYDELKRHTKEDFEGRKKNTKIIKMNRQRVAVLILTLIASKYSFLTFDKNGTTCFQMIYVKMVPQKFPLTENLTPI